MNVLDWEFCLLLILYRTLTYTGHRGTARGPACARFAESAPKQLAATVYGDAVFVEMPLGLPGNALARVR